MDDCGLDAVLSGGQKALGVPPGLSILAVSPRGLERRRSLGRVSAYYADLLNWEASMSSPQTYFSTHSVNLFYALGAALDIIAGEGSEKRYDRHRTLGAAFRAGVEALGFGLLTDGRFLAPTMSVVSYPDGVVDADFLAGLSRNGVVAAGCLGEFKGRGARFGHMGNLGPGELLRALAAVERTLHELGVDVPVGQGVAAAQDALVASSPAVGVAPEAVAAGEAPTRAP
jgi:aspartate aminotransferase-like enzyme